MRTGIANIGLLVTFLCHLSKPENLYKRSKTTLLRPVGLLIDTVLVYRYYHCISFLLTWYIFYIDSQIDIL